MEARQWLLSEQLLEDGQVPNQNNADKEGEKRHGEIAWYVAQYMILVAQPVLSHAHRENAQVGEGAGVATGAEEQPGGYVQQNEQRRYYPDTHNLRDTRVKGDTYDTTCHSMKYVYNDL